MKDCILHGEAMIFKSKIPEGAKRIKVKEYLIIAPSENTGNHHVIDAVEGVEFYEKDGVLYVRNTVEVPVRCLISSRHDNVTLSPCEWEIDGQQEYDPFTARKQRVSD